MVASELISYDIPPLNIHDSGEKALEWMEEFKVVELPVVDENIYCGLISEADVLDANNPEQQIKELQSGLKKPFVYQTQHLFEVISLLVENNISILPVVDGDEKYLGLITSSRIIEFFAKTTSVASQGSIITLELNINDYSLAEISKLVESDNAKILTSYITSHLDSTKMEVTLKINKSDISRILHTFERYNYSVTASYNESDYHDDLKNRYDEFMRFLNI